MLKKAIFLVAIMFSLLLLNACNSSDTAPANVVLAFHKAIEKNDAQAAVKLIYIPEKEQSYEKIIHSKIGVVVATANQNIEKHSGIKNMSTGTIQFGDDKKTAIVPLTIEYKDGSKEETQMHTINDNGKWYILMR